MVKSVELKDLFKQNVTLTLTYLDTSKNLSSIDVEPVRKDIVEKLKQDYNAVLVGNLQ